MRGKLCLVSLLTLTLLLCGLRSAINAQPTDEIIAASGGTPTIDGVLSPGEWDDAETVTFYAVEDNCTVYLKQNGSHLHVAFNISDQSYDANDRSWLKLDVDHGADDNLQPDDLTLNIHRDGSLFEAHGSGGTWQPFPPTNWTGANHDAGMWHTIEYSIAYTKINVTADVSKTLGVAFVVYNMTGPSSAWGYYWPAGSGFAPNTWGDLIFKAPPTIFQGDLVLTGTNVTEIEGWFAINGSIVVKDDATLILRDANVSFVQSANYQHNITLRNQGNLTVENTTLTASDYWLRIDILDSSSAQIDGLGTAWKTSITVNDLAHTWISNLTGLYMLSGYGLSETILNGSQLQILACVHSANVTLLNSHVTNNLLTNGNATFNAQNSDINVMRINSGSINCTIDDLVPGYYNLWTFDDSCSIETSIQSQLPNVTLLKCQVAYWDFQFVGVSHVETIQSDLRSLTLREDSEANIHNSTVEILAVEDNAMMWLVNSTHDEDHTFENASIIINWYLDVHVVDSIGQDVPAANITIRYPNGSEAMSGLTDVNGRIVAILMEKMRNETGEYSIGAYTAEAIYSPHSNTTAVTMAGNQHVILELEDFIIPELPHFALLPLLVMSALVVAIAYKKQKHL